MWALKGLYKSVTKLDPTKTKKRECIVWNGANGRRDYSGSESFYERQRSKQTAKNTRNVLPADQRKEKQHSIC